MNAESILLAQTTDSAALKTRTISFADFPDELNIASNKEDIFDIQLTDMDRARIESMQRALEFVRTIPDKLRDIQEDFNEKYIQSLSERLSIYQNLGTIADPRDFLQIAQEALKLARELLSVNPVGLIDKFDNPDILKSFLNDHIQTGTGAPDKGENTQMENI